MSKGTKLRDRILALLLVMALCCSVLVSPALAEERSMFPTWPQDVPADVRDDWQDPELDKTLLTQLEAALEALLSDAAAGTSAEEVLAGYDKAKDLMNEMYTDYAFVNWYYTREPQTYVEDYSRWLNAVNRAENVLAEAEQVLFSGNYQKDFRDKLGNTYVAFVLDKPILGEEQFALQEQEQALIYEYNLRSAEVRKSLTYDYEGTSYTLDSVKAAHENGEMTEEAYRAVYGPLTKMANAEIGPIYVELVKVRNDFARSLGYDNYADYAFSVIYGRDYSAEEGLAYCLEAIEQVGPLYMRMNAVKDPDIADKTAVDKAMSDLTDKEMIAQVQPHLEKVSEAYADLFQYMLDNGLLDAEALDTKLPIAYSADIPSYDSAHISFGPDYLEARTLIHEFGHFANACLANDDVACYDTAEIHSQGLETLYFSFADDLVGADNGAALLSQWLTSLTKAGVLNGAVIGAFELKAYMEGDMTLDELNQYYGRISSQAGFDNIYGDVGYGWYVIPHVFQNGCYYISYSTSAASALDILLRSQQDFDQAAESYLRLVAQTDVYGYADAVEAAGLTNMMKPGALKTLAAGLEDYVIQQIWEVGPFADVPKHHWAYSDIMAAAAGEVLSAGANGAFAPDRVLTGAELNAAMASLMPESAKGWSSGAGDAVTREELILALYGCAQKELDTSARADLSNYADVGKISAESKDALSWAVAEGLVVGTDAKTLAPDTPATRAQAAAILMRFCEGPLV